MKISNRGVLISIEGIDGAGKSLLAKNIYNYLVHRGHNVVLTREPGGSHLGKHIRELLQEEELVIDPKAEYLLFAADRAQHFKDIIIPSLQANKIVISDRLGDSSLVYQGYGRGLDLDIITQVNRWAMQGMEPDITFYVEVDPQVALERIHKRNEKMSSFEKEKIDFVEKLVKGFQAVFAQRPQVVVLDGHKEAQKVLLDALGALENIKMKQ